MDSCLPLFSAGFSNTEGNKGKQVKKTNVNYKKTGSMGANMRIRHGKEQDEANTTISTTRTGFITGKKMQHTKKRNKEERKCNSKIR